MPALNEATRVRHNQSSSGSGGRAAPSGSKPPRRLRRQQAEIPPSFGDGRARRCQAYAALFLRRGRPPTPYVTGSLLLLLPHLSTVTETPTRRCRSNLTFERRPCLLLSRAKRQRLYVGALASQAATEGDFLMVSSNLLAQTVELRLLDAQVVQCHHVFGRMPD